MENKTKELKSKSVIKTDRLEIGDNIFKFDHAVIQLSNISYFDVSPMPETDYPLWAFAGGIIGFIIIFLGRPVPIMIGLVMITLCIYVIYHIYNSNSKLGDYLVLEMDSGHTFYFSCYSKLFLYEIENVMLQCFKDESLRYSVDMKDCIIVYQEENMSIHNTGNVVNGSGNAVNGSIVNGNGNTVSGVGDINISKGESITNEEWKKLKDAFEEIVSKIDVDSYEHMLAVSAQYQISKKDKTGLRKVIADNVNDFRSNIFSKIAMGGIIEIIKKVVK